MSDLNNVKEIIEKAVESNGKAVEMQMSFYKDFTRRQGETLVQLADKRMNSLNEIASCDSIEKAIENNVAFEKQAKESLEALHASNISAFEELSNSLKGVYNI